MSEHNSSITIDVNADISGFQQQMGALKQEYIDTVKEVSENKIEAPMQEASAVNSFDYMFETLSKASSVLSDIKSTAASLPQGIQSAMMSLISGTRQAMTQLSTNLADAGKKVTDSFNIRALNNQVRFGSTSVHQYAKDLKTAMTLAQQMENGTKAVLDANYKEIASAINPALADLSLRKHRALTDSGIRNEILASNGDYAHIQRLLASKGVTSPAEQQKLVDFAIATSRNRIYRNDAQIGYHYAGIDAGKQKVFAAEAVPEAYAESYRHGGRRDADMSKTPINTAAADRRKTLDYYAGIRKEIMDGNSVAFKAARSAGLITMQGGNYRFAERQYITDDMLNHFSGMVTRERKRAVQSSPQYFRDLNDFDNSYDLLQKENKRIKEVDKIMSLDQRPNADPYIIAGYKRPNGVRYEQGKDAYHAAPALNIPEMINIPRMTVQNVGGKHQLMVKRHNEETGKVKWEPNLNYEWRKEGVLETPDDEFITMGSNPILDRLIKRHAKEGAQFSDRSFGYGFDENDRAKTGLPLIINSTMEEFRDKDKWGNIQFMIEENKKGKTTRKAYFPQEGKIDELIDGLYKGTIKPTLQGPNGKQIPYRAFAGHITGNGSLMFMQDKDYNEMIKEDKAAGIMPMLQYFNEFDSEGRLIDPETGKGFGFDKTTGKYKNTEKGLGAYTRFFDARNKILSHSEPIEKFGSNTPKTAFVNFDAFYNAIDPNKEHPERRFDGGGFIDPSLYPKDFQARMGPAKFLAQRLNWRDYLHDAGFTYKDSSGTEHMYLPGMSATAADYKKYRALLQAGTPENQRHRFFGTADDGSLKTFAQWRDERFVDVMDNQYGALLADTTLKSANKLKSITPEQFNEFAAAQKTRIKRANALSSKSSLTDEEQSEYDSLVSLLPTKTSKRFNTSFQKIARTNENGMVLLTPAQQTELFSVMSNPEIGMGLRLMKDSENYAGKKDYWSPAYMSSVSMTPEMMERSQQNYLKAMQEMQTQEGIIKRMFSGNDYDSRRVQENPYLIYTDRNLQYKIEAEKKDIIQKQRLGYGYFPKDEETGLDFRAQMMAAAVNPYSLFNPIGEDLTGHAAQGEAATLKTNQHGVIAPTAIRNGITNWTRSPYAPGANFFSRALDNAALMRYGMTPDSAFFNIEDFYELNTGDFDGDLVWAYHTLKDDKDFQKRTTARNARIQKLAEKRFKEALKAPKESGDKEIDTDVTSFAQTLNRSLGATSGPTGLGYKLTQAFRMGLFTDEDMALIDDFGNQTYQDGIDMVKHTDVKVREAEGKLIDAMRTRKPFERLTKALQNEYETGKFGNTDIFEYGLPTYVDPIGANMLSLAGQMKELDVNANQDYAEQIRKNISARYAGAYDPERRVAEWGADLLIAKGTGTFQITSDKTLREGAKRLAELQSFTNELEAKGGNAEEVKRLRELHKNASAFLDTESTIGFNENNKEAREAFAEAYHLTNPATKYGYKTEDEAKTAAILYEERQRKEAKRIQQIQENEMGQVFKEQTGKTLTPENRDNVMDRITAAHMFTGFNWSNAKHFVDHDILMPNTRLHRVSLDRGKSGNRENVIENVVSDFARSDQAFNQAQVARSILLGETLATNTDADAIVGLAAHEFMDSYALARTTGKTQAEAEKIAQEAFESKLLGEKDENGIRQLSEAQKKEQAKAGITFSKDDFGNISASISGSGTNDERKKIEERINKKLGEAEFSPGVAAGPNQSSLLNVSRLFFESALGGKQGEHIIMSEGTMFDWDGKKSTPIEPRKSEGHNGIWIVPQKDGTNAIDFERFRKDKKTGDLMPVQAGMYFTPDMIKEDQSGNITIVDWKSSESGQNDAMFQMSLYAHLLEQKSKEYYETKNDDLKKFARFGNYDENTGTFISKIKTLQAVDLFRHNPNTAVLEADYDSSWGQYVFDWFSKGLQNMSVAAKQGFIRQLPQEIRPRFERTMMGDRPVLAPGEDESLYKVKSTEAAGLINDEFSKAQLEHAHEIMSGGTGIRDKEGNYIDQDKAFLVHKYAEDEKKLEDIRSFTYKQRRNLYNIDHYTQDEYTKNINTAKELFKPEDFDTLNKYLKSDSVAPDVLLMQGQFTTQQAEAARQIKEMTELRKEYYDQMPTRMASDYENIRFGRGNVFSKLRSGIQKVQQDISTINEVEKMDAEYDPVLGRIETDESELYKRFYVAPDVTGLSKSEAKKKQKDASDKAKSDAAQVAKTNKAKVQQYETRRREAKGAFAEFDRQMRDQIITDRNAEGNPLLNMFQENGGFEAGLHALRQRAQEYSTLADTTFTKGGKDYVYSTATRQLMASEQRRLAQQARDLENVGATNPDFVNLTHGKENFTSAQLRATMSGTQISASAIKGNALYGFMEQYLKGNRNATVQDLMRAVNQYERTYDRNVASSNAEKELASRGSALSFTSEYNNTPVSADDFARLQAAKFNKKVRDRKQELRGLIRSEENASLRNQYQNELTDLNGMDLRATYGRYLGQAEADENLRLHKQQKSRTALSRTFSGNAPLSLRDMVNDAIEDADAQIEEYIKIAGLNKKQSNQLRNRYRDKSNITRDVTEKYQAMLENERVNEAKQSANLRARLTGIKTSSFEEAGLAVDSLREDIHRHRDSLVKRARRAERNGDDVERDRLLDEAHQFDDQNVDYESYRMRKFEEAEREKELTRRENTRKDRDFQDVSSNNRLDAGARVSRRMEDLRNGISDQLIKLQKDAMAGVYSGYEAEYVARRQALFNFDYNSAESRIRAEENAADRSYFATNQANGIKTDAALENRALTRAQETSVNHARLIQQREDYIAQQLKNKQMDETQADAYRAMFNDPYLLGIATQQANLTFGQRELTNQMDYRQKEAMLSGRSMTVEEQVAQRRDSMIKARDELAERFRNEGRTREEAALRAHSDSELERIARIDVEAEIQQGQRHRQEQLEQAQLQNQLALEQQRHQYEQMNRNLWGPSRSRFVNTYRQQENSRWSLGQTVTQNRGMADITQRNINKWESDFQRKYHMSSSAYRSSGGTDEKALASVDKIQAAQIAFQKYNETAHQAEEQMQQFSKPAMALRAGFTAVGDSVSMLFKRFGRQMFMKALQEAKTFVKQFDKTMTEIQMITLKSDSEMSKVGDGLISKAKEMKISITEISQSAATLYRQGLSDEEVDERLETISKFSKVSGTKVADATKLITVAMNTGLVANADEAADIVTALGDSAATNAQQIEKGVEKAGAAAAADGTTFGQLAAMLTAITSTTQIGGNVAGRTLNTIFGRMNKIGTNELIYDENGNAISGSAVAKLLKAQGIDMYDENGNKRSSFDTLYALSQKWEGMSDAEQQQMANAIAGTRQYSNFSAIMQGMQEGKIDEYMDLIGESTGITNEKFEVYTKSLEAALTDLKNTFDSVIKDLVDSGVVESVTKGLGDIVTGIGAIISAAGGLPGIIAMATPLILAMSFLRGGYAGLAITGGLLGGAGIAAAIGGNINDSAALKRSEEFKEADNIANEQYGFVNKLKTLSKKETLTDEERSQYKEALTKTAIIADADISSDLFKGLISSIDEVGSAASTASTALSEYSDNIIEQAKKNIEVERLRRKMQSSQTFGEFATAEAEKAKLEAANNADFSNHEYAVLFHPRDKADVAYDQYMNGEISKEEYYRIANENSITPSDKEFNYTNKDLHKIIRNAGDFTKTGINIATRNRNKSLIAETLYKTYRGITNPETEEETKAARMTPEEWQNVVAGVMSGRTFEDYGLPSNLGEKVSSYLAGAYEGYDRNQDVDIQTYRSNFRSYVSEIAPYLDEGQLHALEDYYMQLYREERQKGKTDTNALDDALASIIGTKIDPDAVKENIEQSLESANYNPNSIENQLKNYDLEDVGNGGFYIDENNQIYTREEALKVAEDYEKNKTITKPVSYSIQDKTGKILQDESGNDLTFNTEEEYNTAVASYKAKAAEASTGLDKDIADIDSKIEEAEKQIEYHLTTQTPDNKTIRATAHGANAKTIAEKEINDKINAFVQENPYTLYYTQDYTDSNGVFHKKGDFHSYSNEPKTLYESFITDENGNKIETFAPFERDKYIKKAAENRHFYKIYGDDMLNPEYVERDADFIEENEKKKILTKDNLEDFMSYANTLNPDVYKKDKNGNIYMDDPQLGKVVLYDKNGITQAGMAEARMQLTKNTAYSELYDNYLRQNGYKKNVYKINPDTMSGNDYQGVSKLLGVTTEKVASSYATKDSKTALQVSPTEQTMFDFQNGINMLGILQAAKDKLINGAKNGIIAFVDSMADEALVQTEEVLNPENIMPQLKGHKNYFNSRASGSYQAWKDNKNNSYALLADEMLRDVQQFMAPSSTEYQEYANFGKDEYRGTAVQRLLYHVNLKNNARWNQLYQDDEFGRLMDQIVTDDHGNVLSAPEDIVEQITEFLMRKGRDYGAKELTASEKAGIARNAFNGLINDGWFASREAYLDISEKEYNELVKNPWQERYDEYIKTLTAPTSGNTNKENYELSEEYAQKVDQYKKDNHLESLEEYRARAYSDAHYLEDADDEYLQSIIGKRLAQKAIVSPDSLSDEEKAYANMLLENASYGLNGLTAGQRLMGIREVKEKINANELTKYDENDLAANYMSGFANWARYSALIKKKEETGTLSPEEEEKLNEYAQQFENFEQEAVIDYKVEGIESLEKAGKLLEGTTEAVKNLQKGGRFEIEAIIKVSSNLFKQTQLDAMLASDNSNLVDEAVRQITGVSGRQYTDNRQYWIDEANRLRNQERSVTGQSLMEEYELAQDKEGFLNKLSGTGWGADYRYNGSMHEIVGFSYNPEEYKFENPYTGEEKKYTSAELARMRKQILEGSLKEEDIGYKTALTSGGEAWTNYQYMLANSDKYTEAQIEEAGKKAENENAIALREAEEQEALDNAKLNATTIGGAYAYAQLRYQQNNKAALAANNIFTSLTGVEIKTTEDLAKAVSDQDVDNWKDLLESSDDVRKAFDDMGAKVSEDGQSIDFSGVQLEGDALASALSALVSAVAGASDEFKNYKEVRSTGETYDLAKSYMEGSITTEEAYNAFSQVVGNSQVAQIVRNNIDQANIPEGGFIKDNKIFDSEGNVIDTFDPFKGMTGYNRTYAETLFNNAQYNQTGLTDIQRNNFFNEMLDNANNGTLTNLYKEDKVGAFSDITQGMTNADMWIQSQMKLEENGLKMSDLSDPETVKENYDIINDAVKDTYGSVTAAVEAQKEWDAELAGKSVRLTGKFGESTESAAKAIENFTKGGKDAVKQSAQWTKGISQLKDQLLAVSRARGKTPTNVGPREAEMVASWLGLPDKKDVKKLTQKQFDDALDAMEEEAQSTFNQNYFQPMLEGAFNDINKAIGENKITLDQVVDVVTQVNDSGDMSGFISLLESIQSNYASVAEGMAGDILTYLINVVKTTNDASGQVDVDASVSKSSAKTKTGSSYQNLGGGGGGGKSEADKLLEKQKHTMAGIEHEIKMNEAATDDANRSNNYSQFNSLLDQRIQLLIKQRDQYRANIKEMEELLKTTKKEEEITKLQEAIWAAQEAEAAFAKSLADLSKIRLDELLSQFTNVSEQIDHLMKITDLNKSINLLNNDFPAALGSIAEKVNEIQQNIANEEAKLQSLQQNREKAIADTQDGEDSDLVREIDKEIRATTENIKQFGIDLRSVGEEVRDVFQQQFEHESLVSRNASEFYRALSQNQRYNNEYRGSELSLRTSLAYSRENLDNVWNDYLRKEADLNNYEYGTKEWDQAYEAAAGALIEYENALSDVTSLQDELNNFFTEMYSDIQNLLSLDLRKLESIQTGLEFYNDLPNIMINNAMQNATRIKQMLAYRDEYNTQAQRIADYKEEHGGENYEDDNYIQMVTAANEAKINELDMQNQINDSYKQIADAVDEIVQNINDALTHSRTMLQEDIKHAERMEDYDAQFAGIEADNILIDAQNAVGQRSIEDWELLRSMQVEGSDAWNYYDKKITDEQEAIAKRTGEKEASGMKRLAIYDKKQKAEDEPYSKMYSLVDVTTNAALGENNYELAEASLKARYSMTLSDYAQNVEQKKIWEAELENAKTMEEERYIKNKITEIDLDNAKKEKELVDTRLKIAQTVLDSITNSLKLETMNPEHANKMYEMYGAHYSRYSDFNMLRENYANTMSNNESIIGSTRDALNKAIQKRDEYDVGTKEWYNAQKAVFSYTETLQRLINAQDELKEKTEASFLTEITQKYNDAASAVSLLISKLEVLKKTAQASGDETSYALYDKTQLENIEYLTSLDVRHITDLQDTLANSTKGSQTWRNARQQLIDATNKGLSGQSLSSQLLSQSMSNVYKEMDWDKSQKAHNLNLLRSSREVFESRGELRNVNVTYESENEILEESNEASRENIKVLQERYKALEGFPELQNDVTKHIMEEEENIRKNTETIEKNTKARDENTKKILEARKAVEDVVKEQIEAQVERDKKSLASRVSMQNTVLDTMKKYYRDQWDYLKKDIEEQKKHLNKEKSLIDERLNARKSAMQTEDKIREMEELQRQLALLQADPTQSKQAKEVAKKIEDIQKDLSWQKAEEEAKYAQEGIDQQIEAYDEYTSYYDKALEEVLEDNNNFVDALTEIMGGGLETTLDYLTQFNEEYLNSTSEAREKMTQDWDESWKDILQIVDTYWGKINEIISTKEGFLSFMQNTFDAKWMSETGLDISTIDWEKMYDDMVSAEKEPTEANGLTTDEHTMSIRDIIAETIAGLDIDLDAGKESGSYEQLLADLIDAIPVFQTGAQGLNTAAGLYGENGDVYVRYVESVKNQEALFGENGVFDKLGDDISTKAQNIVDGLIGEENGVAKKLGETADSSATAIKNGAEEAAKKAGLAADQLALDIKQGILGMQTALDGPSKKLDTSADSISKAADYVKGIADAIQLKFMTDAKDVMGKNYIGKIPTQAEAMGKYAEGAAKDIATAAFQGAKISGDEATTAAGHLKLKADEVAASLGQPSGSAYDLAKAAGEFSLVADKFNKLFSSNEDYVESLYGYILERESDEGGKKMWVSELENGKTREEVRQGFLHSDEFAGAGGLAEQFVNGVYKELFGALYTSPNYRTWVDQLIATGDREAVRNGIINSDEYKDIISAYDEDHGIGDAAAIGIGDAASVGIGDAASIGIGDASYIAIGDAASIGISSDSVGTSSTSIGKSSTSVGTASGAFYSSNWDKIIKDTIHGPNANGGLIDYTGLAWVDGTKARPESFLDSYDTRLLRSMLDQFDYIKTVPYMSNIDQITPSSTTNVGDINIIINQAELNSDADIEDVARKVGKAFTRQMTKEGFNLSSYAF